MGVLNTTHFRLLFKKMQTVRAMRHRCYSIIPAKEDGYTVSVEISDDVRVNRNKSGLLQQHRNILYEKRPYKEPNSWIHQTEIYQRKVFGRYGSQSGINPRICFQKTSDLETQTAYQNFSEPQTFQSMIMKYRLQSTQKANELQIREIEVSKNMEKLEQWKQELKARSLKKESEALAAKQRKERLVEEVRRHFGYKVDPRDERFKEVLEQKEREEKKKQREAKRQQKEQKLMSKLVGNSS